MRMHCPNHPIYVTYWSAALTVEPRVGCLNPRSGVLVMWVIITEWRENSLRYKSCEVATNWDSFPARSLFGP